MEIKHNALSPSTTKQLPGKILVGIRAVGVNPVDWKICEGHMQQMMNPKFPLTLGMDFSGFVRQLQAGEGVEGGGGAEKPIPSGLVKGDEMYGQAAVPSGGSVERLRRWPSQTRMVLRPSQSLSHTEAAALPLAGVRAWQALIENMGLSGGQKILIHGGQVE